jgi:hypothetical protein
VELGLEVAPGGRGGHHCDVGVARVRWCWHAGGCVLYSRVFYALFKYHYHFNGLRDDEIFVLA